MSNLADTLKFPDKLEVLFQPARYKVLYGGRGGAKSWGIARALLIQGAKEPLRILCTRELQNSIKDSVHRLLVDQVKAMGLEWFYSITTTSIKGLNGTEFSFEGIRHNVNTIRSYEGVDRVWVEEANTVSKKSWEVLIPTIRKDGSEIWISFNPEFEDDETFERFVLNPPASAIVRKVNYKDNPWFPKVLEEERLDLQRKHPDDYDYVWEGNCRKWLENAIYASELRKTMGDGRVTAVPFDPAVPVYTSWDLGRTDSTCIWWYQYVAGEIHVLECYGTNGGNMSEYASQVLGRNVQIDIVDNEVKATLGDAIPELAHRSEYRYERHWLPHDARAKTLAAAGKSIIQQLAAAIPLSKLAIVPMLDVEHGIQAAKMMFGRCWFDANGTLDGMKALRRYQRKEQLDGISLGKSPLHDWTSHYADAFRMMAVAWDSVRQAEKPVDKPIHGVTVGNVHNVTLEQMWAETQTNRVERY